MKSVLALIIKFMAYEGPIITVTMVGDVDGPWRYVFFVWNAENFEVGEMQVSNANDGRCLLRLDMDDVR